jgi:hypothetical protein
MYSLREISGGAGVQSCYATQLIWDGGMCQIADGVSWMIIRGKRRRGGRRKEGEETATN